MEIGSVFSLIAPMEKF